MVLLGVPSVTVRAQNDEAPRLAMDRLGARSTLPLTVSSDAFAPRDPIPIAYTAEGGNLAPPISWTPGPRATRSYVVIAEDADERGGPHRLLWLVYDIPSEQLALGAGARLRISRQRNGPEIARGRNSLGTLGYAGPRPTPAQGTHTYHFQVFALDTVLRAPEGASLPFVIGAMHGHVVAAGETIATFAASKPARVASDDAAKKRQAEEALSSSAPADETPTKPEVKTAAGEAAQATAGPSAPASAPVIVGETKPAPPQGQPPAAEQPTQLLAQTPPAAPGRSGRARAPSVTAPSSPPAARTATRTASPLEPLFSFLSPANSGPQPQAVPVWVSSIAGAPTAAIAPPGKSGSTPPSEVQPIAPAKGRPEPAKTPAPAKPAPPEQHSVPVKSTVVEEKAPAAPAPAPELAQEKPTPLLAAQGPPKPEKAPDIPESAPARTIPKTAPRAPALAGEPQADNPLAPVLSLFTRGSGNPQPQSVPVWVSAYAGAKPVKTPDVAATNTASPPPAPPPAPTVKAAEASAARRTEKVQPEMAPAEPPAKTVEAHAERSAQILERPATTREAPSEPVALLGAPPPETPAPERAARPPERSAPTRIAPEHAPRAKPRRSAPVPGSENPLEPLLSFFSKATGGPQPLSVPVWVATHAGVAASQTAQEPATKTTTVASAEAPAAKPVATAAARSTEKAQVASVRPAQATVEAPPPSPAPAQALPPGLDLYTYPDIELQPLPTDAWRVARERIGLPTLPEVPPITEEQQLLVPQVAAAVAPTVPANAPVKILPDAPAPRATRSEGAPLSAKPAPQASSAAADLDFLVEASVPELTQPLPQPGRILVADLSFIRMPEVPPFANPIPDWVDSDDAAPEVAPEGGEGDAPDAPKPAPAKAVQPMPTKPAGTTGSASAKPAKPAGSGPAAGASRPPPSKPRPGIPSLRPSSGSRSDGAGG